MNTSDALTDFVDQLNAPASTFPTMADFNASSTSEAIKWTYLVQNAAYPSVNTQHGQSIILFVYKLMLYRNSFKSIPQKIEAYKNKI